MTLSPVCDKYIFFIQVHLLQIAVLSIIYFSIKIPVHFLKPQNVRPSKGKIQEGKLEQPTDWKKTYANQTWKGLVPYYKIFPMLF